ncbi:hypothetical protein ACMGE9_12505 [Macrococcus sp. EM39E]|uniref:hypothetical protein n=1 Tax=Macrococcus animalis TaxID=3395467 RepID=UPI0039BEC21C
MEDKTIKQQIIQYEMNRALLNIKDTHKRQTYLIDKMNIERLESLQASLEIINAKNSSFGNDNLSEADRIRERKLATGLKTKVVNLALDNFFHDWEVENGLIPEIEVIRFKVDNNGDMIIDSDKKGKIHRVYFFSDNKKYYVVRHDDRGNQLDVKEFQDGKEGWEYFDSFDAGKVRDGRPNK